MGIGSFGRKMLGGPEKSSSSSGDHAYGAIRDAYTPALGYVTKGGDMMGSLLGVNGAPAQTGALENFANSGGMQFLMDQGQKAVTSSKAASGLLQSGSYGTALEKYGQGLASTYLQDYMKDLMGYSNLGISAGNVMSDAGKFNESNSEGKKSGALQTLGQIAGSFA
jgi:hypothetical protein